MTLVTHRLTAELPREFRGLLDRLEKERGYVPNLYRTLAHNPVLLRDFLQVTADVRSETRLDPKLRELAILTVARVTGAAIQWLSHLPIAVAAGLTPDQVIGLPVWEHHPGFSEIERAVISYAEHVVRAGHVPQQLATDLRVYLDEQETVELAFAVSYYLMVARFQQALEVDVDPEYLGPAKASIGVSA